MRFRLRSTAIRMMAAMMGAAGSVDQLNRGLSDIRIIDTYQGAPFGTSKMTTAGDARRARKNKARRRARRLGHA